ncbi:MAG TPA: RluA family pseudouridine synthase [Polyangiaceae bacterium]|nr:RluA family pseudouridine synthase [Polyangiaceae bacterium]
MRWVLREGDGATLGDVLARASADPLALEDGRVFVGRKRARSRGEALRPGDVVEIAPPVLSAAAPIVLARTNDLVAVEKAAGVPTIGDHTGASHALVATVARVLGIDEARIHPTSRLDREVSGVVVLALSGDAIRRLARARAAGTYERRYVAIAAHAPVPPSGVWSQPIGRARDPRLRAVGGRDAVESQTRYATPGVAPAGQAMLSVAPVTGRTHQIRVHAAHAGAPLLGDRSYGGPARVTLPSGRVLDLGRIALHAARVVVPDSRGAPWSVQSAIPADLRDLWAALGGGGAAWDLCASCPTGKD